MVLTKNPPPEITLLGQFAERVRGDRALRKLNTLSKDVTGLFLVVLIRTGHQMVELHPAEGEMGLPRFCQAFRRTPEGLERCLTCRSLVAFAARYQGLNEYACHGGVSVIAAPAMRRDGMISKHVVVASCAFALDTHTEGWPQVSAHAEDLGTDRAELKRAFYDLPIVSDHKRVIARDITEVAAMILGDLEERIEREYQGELKTPGSGGTVLEESWATLGLARDQSFKEVESAAGSALVDLVVAMVKNDPSIPYSVGNIAHAARVTPNHFSMLFHKQTGQTFQAFLGEQRIARACNLLSNPSLDVAEVANRSGFADPAYFSRRFRRETGYTPTEWRLRQPQVDGAEGPADARPGAT